MGQCVWLFRVIIIYSCVGAASRGVIEDILRQNRFGVLVWQNGYDNCIYRVPGGAPPERKRKPGSSQGWSGKKGYAVAGNYNYSDSTGKAMQRERYRRSGRGVRYDKRSTINNDSENDKEVWAGDNGGWQGNRKKYVFYKSQCNEDAGVSVGGGGAVLKE